MLTPHKVMTDRVGSLAATRLAVDLKEAGFVIVDKDALHKVWREAVVQQREDARCA